MDRDVIRNKDKYIHKQIILSNIVIDGQTEKVSFRASTHDGTE